MSHPALPASILVLLLTSTAQAEQVEITLADRLDGDLSRYCLDIVGSQSRAETEKGLQAHTCYSYQGNLGVDQVFETDRFADGVLYMPEFDVCATVSGLEVGATLGLATCDGSSLQNITLTEPGKLSPADAPTLCFTAGKDTRLGRGGTSRHQIKSLTLQECSEDLTAFQTWQTRSLAH